MAVYAGARPRPALLGPRMERRPRARAVRSRPQVRASGRSGPVGLTLAAIVVTFLLGLIYLSQTLHVAATNYDIDSLTAERERLEQGLRGLQTQIYRLGSEPAILQGAQDQGLGALGRPVAVQSR
jgi:cell division protein FtsL